MSNSDSDLKNVHADLVERLEHDKRLRAVEQKQASMEAVIAEIPRMEARLTEAIRANAPKSPWPAVGALAACVGVLLVLAAAIYTR